MIDRNTCWLDTNGQERSIAEMPQQQLSNVFYFLLLHKNNYSSLITKVIAVIKHELNAKFNGKILPYSYMPTSAFNDELKYLKDNNHLIEHNTYFDVILKNKKIGQIEKPFSNIDEI